MKQHKRFLKATIFADTRARYKSSRATKVFFFIFAGWMLIISGCGKQTNFTGDSNKSQINVAERNLPIAPERKNKTMRVNLEKISFEKPSGFADNSIYVFSSPETVKQGETPEPAEFITVRDGERRNEMIDLETYRESRYEKQKEFKKLSEAQMLGKGKFEAEIVVDKKFVFSDYPALLLGETVKVEEHGTFKRKYTRELLVMTSQSTFFILTYDNHLNNEEVDAKFQRFMDGLRINEDENAAHSQTTDDGFVRRYAGASSVEVPQNWQSERNFIYEKTIEDDDETDGTRLKILQDPDDQQEQPQKNDDPRNAYDGKVREKQTTTIETEQFKGEIESYLVVKKEMYEKVAPDMVERTAKRWARLTGNDGTIVVLSGQSPVKDSQELETTFRRWINSFSLNKNESEGEK